MNQSSTTFLSRRARLKQPARRRFEPEWLESRYLPSVTLPGIVATDPADGSTVLQAPPSFTITFDQSVVDQIDAAFANLLSVPPDQVLPTLVAFDTNLDVEIDQIGADGTPTPYLTGYSTPSLVDTVATTTAPDGTTQTQLVVSLPAGSPTMGQGTYQLDIEPMTLLAGAFAMFEPTSAWATATAPIPIAQFTVLGQGPTLADATSLGTIGTTTQSGSGSIDPANVQSAVALYSFTVPVGQTWQVDTQLLTSAIGSPLQATLALFDANGNVLATSDTGIGSSVDPVDPGLIRDLAGGTYFIGVSTSQNIPGDSFGYNPVTGQPGIGGVNQPAGAFTLDVSATQVIPPTQLVSFNLDHIDALGTSPTGLDLTFSGPVDASPLLVPDQQETALNVVDASGQVWPITILDDRGLQGQLGFVFDEALPPGTYSLVVPSQGGLTDLAGQPVIGPSGNAPGVLATWTVAAPTGPSDPNNLGVLWPGPVNATWNASISGTTTLNAGQEVDDRFVVIYPGWYELESPQADTGPVDLQIATGNGVTITDQGSPPVYYLEPGVYDLRMVNTGSQPATVDWTLLAPPLDHENIAYNGVGQSSALTIDVAGPAPGGSGAAPSPGSFSVNAAPASTSTTTAGPASTSITTSSSSAVVPSPSPAGLTASPIPASLLVSLETNLAGWPATDAWSTTAVGPLANGATVALADAGHGLTLGMHDQTSPSGTDPQAGNEDPMATLDAMPTASMTDGERRLPSRTGGPEAASARVDAMALALAQADPMLQLAGWLTGRLQGLSASPRQPETPAAELGTTLLTAASASSIDRPARDQRSATLAQADLGAPFALLLGTALTYRLSQPIRKWWRRHHTAHSTWPRPYGFARAGQPTSRR